MLSGMWRGLWLVLPLAACSAASGDGGRRVAGLSCAPFARELTGLALRGDAGSWWAQADGRYARSHTPEIGSVLVFRPAERLPSGHVSVVSGVVGPREITVIQANWLPRTLERDRPVVDVSPRGDWTAVRVWWAPIGGLGTHSYATYGFVIPPAPLGHDALAGAADSAARRAAGG